MMIIHVPVGAAGPLLFLLSLLGWPEQEKVLKGQSHIFFWINIEKQPEETEPYNFGLVCDVIP